MDTEKYKTQLMDEQKTLRKELTELGFQRTDVPDNWVATPADPANTEADENVLADRQEAWSARRGEIAALETRYNNVTRALVRLNEGSFGTCRVCGTLIETKRLEANPAAETCKAHLND